MKKNLTTLTMLAITVMLVGCTQQDEQVQKPTDGGGATVISEADDSAKPVDHQAAKPVIPEPEDEASNETGEETKAPAEDTEPSSATETDKNASKE